MAGTFVPRLTVDGVNGGTWWYSSGNPFYTSGYGLPNCTCYAYGRYAEARGTWANLPRWDAKDWYDDATSFHRGQTPALGAVLCLGQTGDGPGHVAIVEQIASNGDIVVSESHYGGTYWNLRTITRASGYNPWGGSFYFQGFIYNEWSPDDPGGGGQPLPPADWHAKTTGAYARTSTEAFDNAVCAYRKLSGLGWTLNAFCAMWGNVGYEGGYNPWRWESDDVPSYPNTPSYGYGLVQFTPSSKYILDTHAQSYTGYAPNWIDHHGNPNDGDAQLEFIHNYADYYSTSSYPISYSEFKTSTLSPSELAKAWLYNYERPGDPASTEADRADEAMYWYGILSPYSPTPIPTTKKMPLWMMCGMPPLY